MITLYGVHGCPRCSALGSMMKKKNIEFQKNEDVDLMIERKFDAIPVLELEDGTILSYGEAIQYINKRE